MHRICAQHAETCLVFFDAFVMEKACRIRVLFFFGGKGILSCSFEHFLLEKASGTWALSTFWPQVRENWLQARRNWLPECPKLAPSTPKLASRMPKIAPRLAKLARAW